jgi:DNA gyrase subunit B
MAGLPFVADWFNSLEASLNKNRREGTYRVSLNTIEGTHGFSGRIAMVVHGVEIEEVLSSEFFDSPDYRRIMTILERLTQPLPEGTTYKCGDKIQPVSSWLETLEWVMKDVRRGLHVQRYKGLGEMNPDQLWDTTMNAEARSLLQVRIEDAVAADEIFTTLMGDQVEPRREFIEMNALSVANLDT